MNDHPKRYFFFQLNWQLTPQGPFEAKSAEELKEDVKALYHIKRFDGEVWEVKKELKKRLEYYAKQHKGV